MNGDGDRRRSWYPPAIRVEGGIKAQSARGAIGESWWSRRFLAVLESFALGSRLARGRRYARAGQVLTLTIEPGAVAAQVQGSRRIPYEVTIRLPAYDEAAWTRIEAALAEQALYSARLLAGDMPAEIEDVFSAAGAPLFPTTERDMYMHCDCPDAQVPCKHIAATFYLLAEAFDADPFQILAWRGRDRETLLRHLRELRSPEPEHPGGAEAGAGSRPSPESILGAYGAVAAVTSAPLAETLDRFWVAPVPLPPQPATLDTDVDLLLRQLPPPPAELGGPELATRLRDYYSTFPRCC